MYGVGAAPRVDHLVYGSPDLPLGVEMIGRLLGVTPASGGRHLGRGTHNALVSLGYRTYLEVIAPDPKQAAPSGGRSFALDGLHEPRLVGWAVACDELPERSERARAQGYDPGPIEAMSRELPTGELLYWKLTRPIGRSEGAPILPFLIDWGESLHPSELSPGGVRLIRLRGVHPNPGVVRRSLAALEVEISVTRGAVAQLVADIATRYGTVVELR